MSAQFRAGAEDLFKLISNVSERQRWDSILHEGTVHKQLDDKNALVRLKMKPVVSMATPHDYALLQSWRQNDDGSYIVASRSIVTDEMPKVKGVARGAVLPSGFLIEPAPPEDGDVRPRTVRGVRTIKPTYLASRQHDELRRSMMGAGAPALHCHCLM